MVISNTGQLPLYLYKKSMFLSMDLARSPTCMHRPDYMSTLQCYCPICPFTIQSEDRHIPDWLSRSQKAQKVTILTHRPRYTVNTAICATHSSACTIHTAKTFNTCPTFAHKQTAHVNFCRAFRRRIWVLCVLWWILNIYGKCCWYWGIWSVTSNTVAVETKPCLSVTVSLSQGSSF